MGNKVRVLSIFFSVALLLLLTASPVHALGDWDFLPLWGGYYDEGSVNIGDTAEPNGLLQLTGNSIDETEFTITDDTSNPFYWSLIKATESGGVYAPDSLRITKNGETTPSLLIDKWNRIGIGTGNPEFRFDVNFYNENVARFKSINPAQTTLEIRNDGGGDSTLLFSDHEANAKWLSSGFDEDAYKLKFGSPYLNNEDFSFSQNGVFTIHKKETGLPSAPVSIGQNAFLTPEHAGSLELSTTLADGGSLQPRYRITGNSLYARHEWFVQNQESALTINDNQWSNVGIGYDDPEYKLHVVGADLQSGEKQAKIARFATNNSTRGFVAIRNTNNSGESVLQMHNGASNGYSVGFDGSSDSFQIAKGLGLVDERFRIDADGEVCIGKCF